MQDFFHFFEQYGYIVGRLTPHGVAFKTLNIQIMTLKAALIMLPVCLNTKSILVRTIVAQ